PSSRRRCGSVGAGGKPSAMRFVLLASGLLALLSGCSKAEFFELIPGNVSLDRRGQSVTLRAVARDRRGVDHADVKPTKWVSADPKVVEVEDGKIIAVGP